MFCSQCGTSVANDASFCHTCGKPVAIVPHESTSIPASSPAQSIAPDITKVAKVHLSKAVPGIKPSAPTRWQIFISIVLVIVLASTYGFILIDALGGNFHTTVKEKNLGGTIVWGGLTFWYVWKSLNRKGWIGALVGVAISVLVIFIGAGISGYVKAQRADILDQVPPLAALKRNFPEIADQVRQELRAIAKDESQKRQQLLAIFKTRVFPLVYASMKTTSDAAVLQYSKAKLHQFRDVGNANASDCVSLMLGKLEGAPPATQERITANTSKENRPPAATQIPPPVATPNSSTLSRCKRT